MKLLQKEKKEHPLLDAVEIVFTIEFQGPTPSRNVLVSDIAKETGSDPSLVSIKEIRTSFGEQKGEVRVFVYSTKEGMAYLEHDYFAKRIKTPSEDKKGPSEDKKGNPKDSSEEKPESKESSPEKPEEKKENNEQKE